MKINKFVRFMLSPNSGGGSGGTDDQLNANNQQQQQQAPDPFAGIALDELDDATRAKIVEAQTRFKQLETEAKDKRNIQSRHDQLQAELQRLQTGIKQNQQQQQRQQQQAEPTLQDKFFSILKEQGLTDEQALAAAKAQSALTTAAQKDHTAQLQQQLAPALHQVAASAITNNFQAAAAESRYLQDYPEVAQAVWEDLQAALEAGQGNACTVGTIQQIARMKFAEQLEAGTIKFGDQQQQQLQVKPPVITQPNNQQQQQQRLSYPGAGAVVRQPQARTQTVTADPETMNAMAIVKKSWDQFSPTGLPVKPLVTRSGS